MNIWLVQVVVAGLVCIAQAQTDSQITGCTSGSESIISLNETITPPSAVFAQTYLVSPFRAPRQNVLHFGHDQGGSLITWCTTNDSDPQVIIFFTEPLIVTRFIASGSTYRPLNRTAYTTNFTIEYRQINESGVYVEYYRTENDNGIKYFTQNEPVKLFNLERPIVAESIRIRPVEWFDSTANPGIVCIGVGLIGCTTSDASVQQITTSTEEVTTEPVTMGTERPITEGTTGGVATAQQIVVIRDYRVLEIALPVALLTLLIVIVIMVTGVLVCFIRGRKYNKYDIPLTTPTSPTSTILDNSALYYSPTERRDTIREVTNDMYGEDSGTNTYVTAIFGGQRLNHHPYSHTVALDNLEVIYSDKNIQYAEIPLKKLPGDGRHNSMEDNSAYVVVSSSREGIDASEHNYGFSLESNSSYGTLLKDGGDQGTDNIYEETAH